MPKGHLAGHHLEGDPAEPSAHPHADVAVYAFLSRQPAARTTNRSLRLIRLSAIMRIARRRSWLALSHQGTVWAIDLVALIPRRVQTGLPVTARQAGHNA